MNDKRQEPSWDLHRDLSQEPTMPSPLQRLPPELIHKIAAISSKHDAVALGFTCKKLYLIIGKQYWVELHTGDDQIGELANCVHQLLKEFPYHRWCFRCSTRHEVPRFGADLFESRTPCAVNTCRSFNSLVGITTYNRWDRIVFPQVQLVMDRHLLGRLYGAPIDILNLSLSSTDGQHAKWRLSRNATITKDAASLLLQERYETVIPFEYEFLDFGERLPCHICPHQHRSTTHIRRSASDNLYTAAYLAMERFFSRTIPDCGVEWKASWYHGDCPFCHTQFHVKYEMNWYRREKIIFITIYKDLGQCRHPAQSHWLRQTPAYSENEQVERERSRHPHSLKEAFERSYFGEGIRPPSPELQFS